MAQSLAKIYVHAVFSTKDRTPCLNHTTRRELYPYMATVLNNLDYPAIKVGGTADHIHILFALSKNISIAQLVERVKKPASKWLKLKGVDFGKFQWQNGYGAFSVSKSNVKKAAEYIENQEKHHRNIIFQDEFRCLLKKHGMAYDERYVWG